MELEVSYDLLGVEPNVSDRFLRDTFRDLALALHPAANEGAERRKALRKFQEIQSAYTTILNHRKGDDNDEGEADTDHIVARIPPTARLYRFSRSMNL